MDKISLGIHVGHDRGAAIVKNGRLIGAIEQERLDRIKHSTSSMLPFLSIDSLLDYCHLKLEDISTIGITHAAVDINDLESFYYDQLKDYYQEDRFKLIPVSHHQAHAETVFNTSDFGESLILVADGGGDLVGLQEESESLYIGQGNNVRLLERRLQSQFVHNLSRIQNHCYPFMNKQYLDEPINIAKKYEQITNLIGFGWGEAGKTMGLASYGESLFDFSNITANGLKFNLTFGDILKELYNLYLVSGISYGEFIQTQKANIAMSIQTYIEKILVEIISSVVKKYGINNVCLSGGLFLNCLANHKLLEKIDNLNLHICPASGDEGQAIGAAFYAYKFLDNNITRDSNVLPYLGLDYSEKNILNAINEKGLIAKKYSSQDLAKVLAKEIFDNKIIGYYTGRSEIGPRALCHRSLLANPTWSGMKDHLNINVKHRENFRPFAPVVIEERQFEIFNLKQSSPYMLLAPKTNKNYIEKISSVVHIDGTARVQAISQSKHPVLHNILVEFEKLSGIPVLLNTSFNDNGEPIVDSPQDAIKTFLTTNIDILVLENYLIKK